MKNSFKIILSTLLISMGTTTYASECLQNLDTYLRSLGNNPKYYTGAIDCQADNDETQVVTEEGRLIFKSKKLCIITTTQGDNGETILVNLTEPGNGTHYFSPHKAKYEHHDDSFTATVEENVYPSGNVTKKYVSETKLKIKGTSSMTPAIEFTRTKKKFFGKNELLYKNTYNCQRLL